MVLAASARTAMPLGELGRRLTPTHTPAPPRNGHPRARRGHQNLPSGVTQWEREAHLQQTQAETDAQLNGEPPTRPTASQPQGPHTTVARQPRRDGTPTD